ncbi:MAG: hypothetical protein M3461_22975 [Pseudomonadota bacterium]|nr:hypothetical protein [Pseudomonadota bacterium]
MPSFKGTIEYFLADFPRTLFPLDTNRVLIEHAANTLANVIYESITHNSESEKSFLSQTRAYAAKPNFHLRRTLKLDALAEFFLYDITYRHRSQFRKSPRADRKNFGYRFAGGRMVSPVESYREFRASVRERLKRVRYCAKVDIAQYFNSVYQHDLVNWFRGCAKTEEDVLLPRQVLSRDQCREVDRLPAARHLPCEDHRQPFPAFHRGHEPIDRGRDASLHG